MPKTGDGMKVVLTCSIPIELGLKFRKRAERANMSVVQYIRHLIEEDCKNER